MPYSCPSLLSDFPQSPNAPFSAFNIHSLSTSWSSYQSMRYQCLLMIYGWNCSWKCGYWYQTVLNVDLADLLVALWFLQLDLSVGVGMLAPQERLVARTGGGTRPREQLSPQEPLGVKSRRWQWLYQKETVSEATLGTRVDLLEWVVSECPWETAGPPVYGVCPPTWKVF